MELVSLFLFLRLLPACPAEGWVTSEFGQREDPLKHTTRFHKGVDVGNKKGTPLFVPWDGKVVRVSQSRYRGQFVTVRSGPFYVSFFHLHTFFVKVGDQVKKGDPLGLMGESGRATGPHVHLEMRHHGKIQDPSFLLFRCPELP